MNGFLRHGIKGTISFSILFLAIFLLYNQAAAYSQRVSHAQADALLAEVNSRRAANGLSPYTYSSALMAAAQAHSAYQASISSATHTGADGSRPNGRAVAVGYGGGASVSVTENIYSGMNASPAKAVDWWIADGGWHLEGVLSSTYQDAGAGAAMSGSVVYYTLDVGYVHGAVAAPQAASAGSSAATTPQAAAVKPMVLSTPAADGSITHIVETGQTLWTIAAKYNVPLQDILTLNNFTGNSFVHPGDKVLVKGPGDVAPTSEDSQESSEGNPTPEAPVEITPSDTPSATPLLPSPTVTPATSSQGMGISWQILASLAIGLIALFAVIVLSIVRREG